MTLTLENPIRNTTHIDIDSIEIPHGFKITELGLIPKDWETDSIINLASITTGSKNTQDNVQDGRYPFFVRSSTVQKINTYSFDGEAVLTAGDGVGTGKVFHYINGKFDFHQRVYKISHFCEHLHGYFFYLYFSNYFYNRIMQMTAKSSVDSVRREMIADMLIPLPPLPQQRAIAAALNDVDSLINSLDQLIAKKRNIKLAAMQQLLTGTKRLPEFHDEWRHTKLKDIGKFSKGKGIKKEDIIQNGVPCIRYGEIYTHHNDVIKQFYSFIPKVIAKESQVLKFGDLLFTLSGETANEIGKCVAFVSNVEAYAGGDIAIFSPIGPDSIFLGYLMNHPSITNQKVKMAQGDAVVHISARNLAKIELYLPPLDEQIAIAKVLTDMDTELSTLEQQLAKARNLKQGMMQELLTGRIRLT